MIMVATVGFDAGDDSETKCITQNTSGCGAGCSQSGCQDSGRSSCVTDQAAESCSDRKESDSTTRWGIETVCVKCKATTAQANYLHIWSNYFIHCIADMYSCMYIFIRH